MALEEEALHHHRQREVEELEELLAELGLHGDALAAATAQLAESDESMLKVMMALEFGPWRRSAARHGWRWPYRVSCSW